MERSANKRRKILNNAVKLFIENDIKKVTMDDIAGRSNVSKMTVYKYFTDKENLYLHVGRSLIENCMKDMQAQYELNEDAAGRLTGCIEVFIDFICRDYLSICLKLAPLNENICEEIKTFNAYVREIILKLILEGQEKNLVRRDVGEECLYHYVNMALSYFQHDLEYRKKATEEPLFKNDFMVFLWSNIFLDQLHDTAAKENAG